AVDDQGFPPGLHAGVALLIWPALVEWESFSVPSNEFVPLGLGVHQVHFPCDGGVGRSQLAQRFARRTVSEDAEARALPFDGRGSARFVGRRRSVKARRFGSDEEFGWM